MSIKKNIAILGSTGSIGTQALEVISELPDMFQVEDKINLLSDALASINLERMPDQFKPKNELIKNSF